MRLWTVQSLDWYEVLLKNKTIFADANQIDFIDDDFKIAYQWLIVQMEQKIGKRPDPACYPIWAWYQWQSQDKPKPDLRYSSVGNRGQKKRFARNP